MAKRKIIAAEEVEEGIEEVEEAEAVMENGVMAEAEEEKDQEVTEDVEVDVALVVEVKDNKRVIERKTDFLITV